MQSILYLAAATTIALLLIATNLVTANTFNTFPRFLGSQTFSDITNQVGLGANIPLRVSSLIDFENNKNIDLIGIREDNPSCIEVRAWNSNAKQFSTVIPITPGCHDTVYNKSARVYISAAAVDINRDGLLDIVATHKDNVDLIIQQKPEHGGVTGALLIQSDVIKFPSEAGSSKLLAGSSANVVNYFSDCALHDIIAINSDKSMVVFRNMLAKTSGADGGDTCTSDKWSAPAMSNLTLVPQLGTIVKNVVPAAIATVDLDGDCAAELVFAVSNPTSRTMEFRVAPLSSANIIVDSGKDAKNPPIFSVPDDFGPPTWADFNGDGAVDVAFAVCVTATSDSDKASSAKASSSPSADVSDSDQQQFAAVGDYKLTNCTQANNFTGVLVLLSKNSGACPDNDCCAKFDYSFDSVSNNMVSLPMSAKLSPVTAHVSRVGDSSSSSSSSSSSTAEKGDAAAASAESGSDPLDPSRGKTCYLTSADSLLMPLKIRPGDINDDGKCDAVVSSVCGPLLLRNAGAGVFTSELFVTKGTTSVVGENQVLDIQLLSSEAALPFFFDVNDDGRLDIIISHRGNWSWCLAGTNTSACIGGVFVFWHRGAEDRTNYFITAATLNGATNLPDASWGAIQLGATVRFQHLDIDNDKHSAGGTQIPATSYFELSLPRPHFGIGLTFASVLNFATGMNIDGAAVIKSWPTVYLTPNSQILCVPYPIKDPNSWVLRLYLVGDWDLELVLIAWLVALTVIGVPILALGIREVHEDRRSFGLA